MIKKQEELNDQAKQINSLNKNILNSELALQQVKIWINKLRERLEPLVEKEWFGDNKLELADAPLNEQIISIKNMIQVVLEEDIISKKEEMNEAEFTKRTEVVEIVDNEFSLKNIRVKSKNKLGKFGNEVKIDSDEENEKAEEDLKNEILDERRKIKFISEKYEKL